MIDDDRLLSGSGLMITRSWSGLMIALLTLIWRRILRVRRRSMSATLTVRLISGRRRIVSRWWALIAVAQLRIIILRCLSWRGSCSASAGCSSLLMPRCIYQRHIDHQNHADRNKKLQLLHLNAKSFIYSHQIIITKRLFNDISALVELSN